MFEGAMMWEQRRLTRSWTWMAGMSIQASLVGAAILIPLLKPDALPRARWQPSWFMPLVSAGPARPAASQASARSARTKVPFDPARLVAPAKVPDRLVQGVEDVGGPPSLSGAGSAYSDFPDGVGRGVIGGLDDGTRAMLPPPPVERAEPVRRDPPAAAAIPRITMGGLVLEGKLLHKVMPVYPVLARVARISGLVRLVGVVGTDGYIRKLDVVGGHPLLVDAAVNAVRQWVYRPTMLNGTPVEVIAPIDVTFRLNQ